MENIPFSQRFIGAVLVAVVSGLIVHVIINRSSVPLIQSLLEPEPTRMEPTAPPPIETKDQEPGPRESVPTAAPASSAITSTDISGNWAGKWSTTDGYLFALTMDLQLDHETVVTGSIEWTLKLAPRLEEQHLIGRSAIELVRGSFNPDSGELMLQGYDKVDQFGVISLDSYRLNLSEDAQEIRGKNRGNGGLQGVFIATRQLQ